MEDFKGLPVFSANEEENIEEVEENVVIATASDLYGKEPDTDEGDTNDNSTDNDEDGGTPNDAPEEEKDPLAVSVYNSLVEKGVITSDEEFDGTFDKIESYFDNIQTESREHILNNLPEKGQEIAKFIINGGSSITDDDIFNFVNKYRETTTSDEVSTVEEAKAIIEENLKKAGIDDPDDISVNIDLIEAKGEDKLIERARQYQKANKPNLDEEIKAAEQARLTQEAAEKEYTKTLLAELDNSKYSKKRKEEIHTAIRNDKVTETLIKALENPKSLLQLANLVLHFDDKNGFDFQEFVKQVQSKDVNKIKEKAFSDNFTSVGSGSGNHRQSSTNLLADNFEFVKP